MQDACIIRPKRDHTHMVNIVSFKYQSISIGIQVSFLAHIGAKKIMIVLHVNFQASVPFGYHLFNAARRLCGHRTLAVQ